MGKNSKGLEQKSVSKHGGLVILVIFILIGSAVIFLPNITAYVKDLKENITPSEGKKPSSNDKPKDDLYNTLNCEKKDIDKGWEVEYRHSISFVGSRLLQTHSKIRHRFETNQERDNYQDICLNGKEKLKEVNGLFINCSIDGSTQVTTEVVDFSLFNQQDYLNASKENLIDELKFQKQESLTNIKSRLEQENYSCEYE